MEKQISKVLTELGFSRELKPVFTILIAFLITSIIVFLVYLLMKRIEKKIVSKIVVKSKTKWDDYIIKRGFFKYVNILIPLTVYEAVMGDMTFYNGFISKIIKIGIVITFVFIFNSILAASNDIYSTYRISKERPIKSYIQVINLVVVLIAILITIAILFDKSPLTLLSGIGAMTAVIMLIFKDSILGFVASIQLAANNMVAIGDWIEMPSQDADGDVIEINLTNVKVQNWDKTITTIPSYALVSNSFINWKGMTDSGGRRIKRSIYIDSTTVRFLTDEDFEKFREVELLQNYLNEKNTEICEYNKNKKNLILDGRRLTNIGTFRAYVDFYLKNHPSIDKEKTILVRQKEPSSVGIPMELYCFTNTTAWLAYEGIQSDIFDHLLVIIDYFGLSIFQNPSGQDFRNYRS